jgi:hypothetical protein
MAKMDILAFTLAVQTVFYRLVIGVIMPVLQCHLLSVVFGNSSETRFFMARLYPFYSFKI